MSSINVLNGTVYDLSRTPQTDTVTIRPLIPTDVEGVTGLGVLDDGVITGDPVTVATNSLGEFTVAILPTSQTRAGASGIGVRYRVELSSTEFVIIEMPDAPARNLSELIGGRVAAVIVDAEEVVYERNKDILVAGDNITLVDNDVDRTITISSLGGSSDPLSGQTAAQVRALIQAGVEDWAETDNTDTIPDAKIPEGIARDTEVADAIATEITERSVADAALGTRIDNLPTPLTSSQVDARVRAGVSDWAESGNADPIPADKLTNAPSGTGGGDVTTAQFDDLVDRVEEIEDGPKVLNGVPLASETTLGNLVINDDEAELTVEGITHAATPQTATFADYTSANLIGFFEFDPDLASFNVGQWYWNTLSHRARVITDLDPIAAGAQKGWIDAVLTELIPGNEAYTGEFPSDEAAAPHVASRGDVYYNTTNRSLRLALTVTPGIGPVTGYIYKRVATDDDLGALSTRIQDNAEDITELQAEASSLAQSIAGEGTQREQGDDIQLVTVSTAASYNSTLDSQLGSANPLVLVIDTAITGTRSSASFSYDAGDVLYIPPVSDSIEFLFNLGAATGGVSAEQLQQEITDRSTADTALGSRIDDISENEVRVVAISNWEHSTAARTIQLMVYPPEDIAGSQTLRFSIAGTPASASSGGGIDSNGDVVSVSLNAAAAANINGSASRNGFVPVDWSHGGVTYHGAMDYIPAPPGSGLNQTQVDARVRAGVSDWAETGNTGTLPDTKLSAQITQRLLPQFPSNHQRNGRIAIFNGVSLVWSSLSSTIADQIRPVNANLEARINRIRQLPELPASGARDNMIPKFSGDTLGWEEDDAGPTFTRYANEAALPATVPANTIAWYPE